MKTFVMHLELSPHCVYNCLLIDSIFVFIKINLQEVEEQMLLSKQRLIVEKLRELRATSPTLSMVSRLDVTRSSAVQCMSCTALEKRVEGLELAVRQLKATMSLQHDSSTAPAQSTSSAALASPSPGITHCLDRETPSAPRSPASPALLQGYRWEECLNTGPTVAPSPQPQPSELLSNLFFWEEDLHSFVTHIHRAFKAYLNGPMLPF